MQIFPLFASFNIKESSPLFTDDRGTDFHLVTWSATSRLDERGIKIPVDGFEEGKDYQSILSSKLTTYASGARAYDDRAYFRTKDAIPNIEHIICDCPQHYTDNWPNNNPEDRGYYEYSFNSTT